jgi:hypothetical protein
MFRYSQFDFPEMANNSKMLKMIINIIIISFIIILLYININTKDDVKIISTNSRRIITTLNNYTETMSEFIVSNNDLNENTDELNEIKNIRFTINYFKELKEAELKQQELKQQELKLQELKQQELKLEELENKKNKAISLIKSYIPNYDNLIRLSSSHIEIDGYSNNNNCMKEMIKINREELFNNLIKIDYKNNEVSFNYLNNTNNDYYKNTDNIIRSHLYTDYDKNNRYYNYSHYIYRNYKDNIIKNPIYQIIKNQLKIDYSYIEPNLESYYNNKSRYFSKSLNDFSETYNNYRQYNKYYEKYENDTYYLYTKYNDVNSNYKSYYLNEYLIENKIIINNPNSIDIYNKHPYKFICDISSRSINNYPTISNNYLYSYSIFNNFCCSNSWGCYSCRTYIDNTNIEYVLNDFNYDNNNKYYNNEYSSSYGRVSIHNFNKYSFELDKNKGTRMIKHNLTNNIISLYDYPNERLMIQNHYFIEKVYIDFPLIEIYDEYDYIKKILSSIADIYNLPIIPSIKFI